MLLSWDETNVVDIQFLATYAELAESRCLIDHVAREFDLSHIITATTGDKVDCHAIDRGTSNVGEISEIDQLIIDRHV